MTTSKPDTQELVKHYLHNSLQQCGLTDPAVCEVLVVPVLRLLEQAWDAGNYADKTQENPWRGYTLSQIVTTTEK